MAMSMVASAAHATFLDFVIQPPSDSGSIGFNGSDPLAANSIKVVNIIGIDTPSQSGAISLCQDCTLSFATGVFIGYAANTWDFGPGGSISVYGGVDLTGDGDTNDAGDIASGSLLLSGSFNAARVLGLNGGNYSFQIAGGDFFDSKHIALLDYYGLPTTGGYQGNLNLSFLAQLNPDGDSQTADFINVPNGIGSGDIINQPIVPVPAAAWLFGTGLIGMTVIARRSKHS